MAWWPSRTMSRTPERPVASASVRRRGLLPDQIPCACVYTASRRGPERKRREPRPTGATNPHPIGCRPTNQQEETRMLRRLALAAAFAVASLGVAHAADPITIGFGMALTGGLAPNGKAALLAMQIWESDTNAKGGLLGRPVKLVYYDDQTAAAQVPGIYTKLLDVDRVELIVGPYSTIMTAPAMPVVMAHNMVIVSLTALGVNEQFHYPKYFAMIQTGPNPDVVFSRGYFTVAASQRPAPATVALASSDQEFSRNAADGARANAKAHGLRIVYDKSYPPGTTDFAPVVRAVQAANPD